MFKELRWKIPLILIAVASSLWLCLPLGKKITLGLDLQGGMHLVLEVQSDKAVEISLDRVADDIRRSVQSGDVEVEKILASHEDNEVRIKLVDASDAPAIEKIMKDYVHMEKKKSDSTELVYAFTNKEVERIKENSIHQGLETIRNRVDQFGVAEPNIQRQGENRILVQLPGIKDPERAINLIGKTARLEFKLVDDTRSVDEAMKNLPDGEQILYQRVTNKETGEVTKTPYLLKARPVLTGDTLTGAEVRFDSQYDEPYVSLSFNSYGAMVFQQVTKENIKKRLAIVLDDTVYSAPVIQDEIAGGHAQITGHFTSEDAKDLAIILRAGALPAPVKILENRTVGPSLGKDSIESGIRSFIIGGVVLVIFIVIYYKWSGVVANLALALNVVLLLGALAYFGASLTLPGIAGIVLTVGMAIDANVIIYERIREELRIGKTPRAAIEAGFSKAMSTIVDSNLTTLIAAIVLFQFGTGPVKGFAITLSIGIIASMFTAVFVSHVIFESVMSRKKITRMSI